jgi:hypothetical protein
MSRFRIFLISGLVALGGFVAAAPSASAQAETQAHGSCLGVLSSFAGSQQDDDILREDFAPAPGGDVAAVAEQKGNLTFCAGLIGF